METRSCDNKKVDPRRKVAHRDLYCASSLFAVVAAGTMTRDVTPVEFFECNE